MTDTYTTTCQQIMGLNPDHEDFTRRLEEFKTDLESSTAKNMILPLLLTAQDYCQSATDSAHKSTVAICLNIVFKKTSTSTLLEWIKECHDKSKGIYKDIYKESLLSILTNEFIAHINQTSRMDMEAVEGGTRAAIYRTEEESRKALLALRAPAPKVIELYTHHTQTLQKLLKPKQENPPRPRPKCK